jgi:type II secretory pathway pseudopilin PulG
MIELEPVVRLVVVVAIIVVGSAAILPSYLMGLRNIRMKNRQFTENMK